MTDKLPKKNSPETLMRGKWSVQDQLYEKSYSTTNVFEIWCFPSSFGPTATTTAV